MSKLDEIEARTEERRKHSPLAMEMAADIDDLLDVARAAEELLASAEGYATEAKANGVWNASDPDCLIVVGIIAKLQPALKGKQAGGKG